MSEIVMRVAQSQNPLEHFITVFNETNGAPLLILTLISMIVGIFGMFCLVSFSRKKKDRRGRNCFSSFSKKASRVDDS